MGHERALVHVEQVTRRPINDTSYSVKENLSLRRIERAETNVMIFSRLCISEENEVTTVRQEIGPAVRFFLRIDLGGELRRATHGRDAMQTFWSTEENH